jgi:glycosyltransferase involved in cell wall biosynthesis
MPSGCGFYRVVLPLDELARNGWKTGYSLGMPDWDPGVFVGQRFDQAGVLPLWRTLKDHYGLVYEIDDDPFTVDKANWLATVTYTREEALATIREAAAIADLVTVTTEPLAGVFRKFNPEVRVLPNYIPASMLALKRPRHEKLTMGWAGGVSHMRDVAMIAQTWRDVLDETGVRGHFVGTQYFNMMRPRGFDYTPWAPDPRDYYELLDFDIGLVPIADVPFARSKSWVKALEFAALGIPVIASDCEAYRDFVIDGLTGFLVRTQHEWREAMMTLITDERLRAEMGNAARRHARAYTIEGNWQQWDKVYSELL